MFMVLYVLDQVNLLDELLEAWSKAGAAGVTLLESSGVHRRRARRHVPMRYAFESLGPGRIENNYSLLSIIADEQTAQRCLEATQHVVGDLANPHTGVFCSWELGITAGVPKRPNCGGEAR